MEALTLWVCVCVCGEAGPFQLIPASLGYGVTEEGGR